MADKVIGVGLIGCGNIGQIHAASLGALAEAGEAIRPVMAADLSGECRDEACSNWAFERVVADPAELIANPEVDAVFICTPTPTHRDLILAALAAGKNIYTEKPLAPSFAVVNEICAAVSAAPVIAQVGFQMRCNAMHAKVKKFVETNELGRPMSYLVRDDEAWPTTTVSSFASNWRSQKQFSGGGPLIEHTIHAIDLVSWMFGPARRVSAATNSVFGFDVEDAAGVVIEHDSGVIGTLMTLYGGVQGREESRFEVFFERGVVEITWGVLVNTEENSFRLEQSGESPVRIPTEQIIEAHLADLGGCPMPNFWNELASRNFFASIRAHTPASPGIRDALIAHATVEAAYRSAREKRSVELRELID